MYMFNKTPKDYAVLREKMVKEQLVTRGIKDKNVLNAMRTVPRHLFVPDRNKAEAYSDDPLPIGNNQTISQPYIVASMTEQLNINSKSKVLEIGTGCGYQSAVLAEIAGEVYTIEIIPELYNETVKRLDELFYKNIITKLGDGTQGWEEHSPFDGIIITAAALKIPENLVEQLAINGTMVLPLQEKLYNQQTLYRITKTEDGIKKDALFGVRFVPMTGYN
jgi:protein-L-isoaspartate(D-aspartate) O-methyltransferase